MSKLAVMARGQLREVLADVEPGVTAKLRAALVTGCVDGRVYWRWGVRMGCVLGTIAFAEGAEDPSLAARARLGASAKLEDWAALISPGDVPGASEEFFGGGPRRAALLVQWIDEFEAERVAA